MVPPVVELLATQADTFLSLGPTTTPEIQLTRRDDEVWTDYDVILGEGKRFSLERKGDHHFFCSGSGFAQIFILQTLTSRMLLLSHYVKMAEHPRRRRLYTSLQRNFSWPNMSINCNAVARNCISGVRSRINLQKSQKKCLHSPLQYR